MLMFHPDNSGSSGPLWLGDWKYQIDLPKLWGFEELQTFN
jgi:hypothetical protein